MNTTIFIAERRLFIQVILPANLIKYELVINVFNFKMIIFNCGITTKVICAFLLHGIYIYNLSELNFVNLI